MFAPAVKEFEAALPPSKTTATSTSIAGSSATTKPLAQQQFPVGGGSSSSSGGPVSAAARQRFGAGTSIMAGGNNALKPAPASAINTAPSKGLGPSSTKNPLKRTASQSFRGDEGRHSRAPSVRPSLSTTASTRSTASSVSTASKGGVMPQPVGTGILGKLHDGVYFEEGDFDDDADLDFDTTPGVQRKAMLPPPKAITPTPAPKAAATAAPPTIAAAAGAAQPHRSPSPDIQIVSPPRLLSSAPVPWSSSPLEHKGPPPNAAALRRANTTNTITIDDDLLNNDPADHTSQPRELKKRALPWAKAPTSANSDNNDVSVTNGNMSRDLATPASKTGTRSPYPWNKTASAVKEEQKRLRRQTTQEKKMTMKDAKVIRPDQMATTASPTTRKVKSSRPKLALIYLSEEQTKVLNLVVDGRKSVFFTGSAGTGKSVLMREIITKLRLKFSREADRLAVTASTGLAACNIGGTTLHSFAGIGLGKEAAEELVKKIKRNQKAKQRWLRTKVLVVDEISMVDGDLFDKLEKVARIIRNNGRPFGGIQLVVTGDFFQLPPVPDHGRIAKFAFDAGTWTTSIDHTIGLTQIFRQKDPVFANMLNEMRIGRLSQKSIDAFYRMNRQIMSNDDFVQATELFPTRNEVENANNLRMRQLSGNAFSFQATDGGSIQDVEQRTKLLSNCMAPLSLTLKKGAQVMLIKNVDDSLVNGSIGKVVAFMDEKTFDRYHENEDEFLTYRSQDATQEQGPEPPTDPVLAARAKLQGMLHKDSRALGSTSDLWPLVRFQTADGGHKELLVTREQWKIELPNGEVQASRSQVPLILAWALSIHKAQGQTLEHVRVDLGKIFEKGQAYVALSRATTAEGLQINNFDPNKVMAHDKVRGFYDKLYSADSACEAGFGGGGLQRNIGTGGAADGKASASLRRKRSSGGGFGLDGDDDDEFDAALLADAEAQYAFAR